MFADAVRARGKPIKHTHYEMSRWEIDQRIGVTDRFLQKSENSNGLQKFVEVVVERGRRILALDVRMKFLSIRLLQRHFDQISCP